MTKKTKKEKNFMQKARKTTKKPIKKTTKKVTARKTVSRTAPRKQSELQKLTAKENAPMKALNSCAKEWDTKLAKANNAEQKKKINARFSARFNKLDKAHTICNINTQICRLKREKEKLHKK